jgi:glycosyltransferase involved in cell wall biosynthesis
MDYAEMFVGRLLQGVVYRVAPSWFRTILCLSGSTAVELRNKRVFRPSGRVTVVGLGLSDRDALYPGDFEARDPREVLFLGDSRPRKGLEDLLAAMSRVGEQVEGARLTIASREDLRHLSERAETYELSYIPSPNVDALAQLYRSCGAFVSASWAEGFGLPPLEAMACGAPVVVTDSRGVREFARHEVNCLLVPPRDPCALAEAIVRLLLDRGTAGRLGAQGVVTASEYQWETALDRFEGVLREMWAAARYGR